MNNPILILEDQTDKQIKLSELDNMQTISNIPVKIDKALYDLSGTTMIGVSGTLILRGIKLRGVWDIMGNPLEFKKILTLNIKNNFIDINGIFEGIPKEYFKLVKASLIE